MHWEGRSSNPNAMRPLAWVLAGPGPAASRPPAGPQAVMARVGAGFSVPAQVCARCRVPPCLSSCRRLAAHNRCAAGVDLLVQARPGALFPQQPRPGIPFPQVRPPMPVSPGRTPAVIGGGRMTCCKCLVVRPVTRQPDACTAGRGPAQATACATACHVSSPATSDATPAAPSMWWRPQRLPSPSSHAWGG